ncbi:MAG: hypothetical protein JW731_12285 [Bacteroidales bacterium]|nr:hypothetical protein [Bacteroidales bacterium]
MNRITNFLFPAITIIMLSSLHSESQNYRLIDLKNPAFDPPSLNYYILEIIDSRDLKSSIGMVKTGDEQELVMLDFQAGFHDELTLYFNTAYKAEEGKIPIILNIKKLWVTEFEKEGLTYSKCELNMEFLTPKKQKFHECSDKNEMDLSTNKDAHKDNITVSLNSCMHYLSDPDLQNDYYTILNSSAPAVVTEKVLESDVEKNPETQTKTEPEIKTGTEQVKTVKGMEGRDFHKTSKSRITLQGGYTYRLGKIPDGLDSESESHIKRLKNGFNGGADINFFWNRGNALGVSTSYSQAESTLPDVVVLDENGIILAQGDLSETIGLFYIGPSYFGRSISKSGNTHWLSGLTLGYYAFNEELSWLGETIDITGRTVGFGFSFGVDFLTSDNFAIGLQAALLMGWLDKVEIDGEEVELDETENLSRIDLTIGIRFLP